MYTIIYFVLFSRCKISRQHQWRSSQWYDGFWHERRYFKHHFGFSSRPHNVRILYGLPIFEYCILYAIITFFYHRSQQPVLDTTLSSSTSKSSVKDPKANVIKEEPEAEKKEETTTDVVANGAPEGKIFFICWRKSNNSHMHDVGWTSTLITIGFGSFLFCFNLVLHTLNTLVSFI